MKELGLGSRSLKDVESYWDRRPCNIKHSKLEIGTKEYFDEIEERKYFVEPHIPKFADFQAWKGKNVLEIGCGIGTDAVNFIRAGANYTGTDLSANSVSLARKRLEVYGLEGEILHANGEELCLPQKFDLIYSFGVIHHSPNPRKIVERAHAMCKADGILKIMLYAKSSWKTALIDAGLDQPEAQSGCPIAYSFDSTDVRELLSGLFSITEYRQDHIFPFVLEKYKEYEYELLPWFKEMPPEIYSALCANFGWHGLVTAGRMSST